MKVYTNEEIEKKVREIWKDGDEYTWRELDVAIDQRNGEVHLTISRMYEAPGLNLAKLMALAEFFGTKNINDDDRFSNSGCETCDYGSSYGFTLAVRPEKEAANGVG